jgi:2-polyprenyl-3-methyl-5-hydroxy-6-metoxy-1,4-benzoquinol methylase
MEKIISEKNIFSYLQEILDSADGKETKFKVLEAGCGSVSRLKFSDKHFITGIDISQKQLDRNPNVHEKVLGDIQTFKFPASSFDMIVCWHVLEHLPKPQNALRMFFSSVKNNGRIIISSPNPSSLKGLVTKFTPHFFHIYVYRYIYKVKNAGREDTAPFKTFMRFAIRPHNISKVAKEYGINTEILITEDAFRDWVGQKFRNKSKILFLFVTALIKILNAISGGKIGDSEYTLVLKKD